MDIGIYATGLLKVFYLVGLEGPQSQKIKARDFKNRPNWRFLQLNWAKLNSLVEKGKGDIRRVILCDTVSTKSVLHDVTMRIYMRSICRANSETLVPVAFEPL